MPETEEAVAGPVWREQSCGNTAGCGAGENEPGAHVRAGDRADQCRRRRQGLKIFRAYRRGTKSRATKKMIPTGMATVIMSTTKSGTMPWGKKPTCGGVSWAKTREEWNHKDRRRKEAFL